MNLVFVSILGLFVFSLPCVANFMAEKWEPVSVLDSADIKQLNPQAIVVLGGGVKKSGIEFGDGFVLKNRTLQRLRYGAKLAHENGLPILVSGGQVFDKYAVTEAKLMTEALQAEFGLNVYWRENQSRNTAENARYSQIMLKKDRVDRIILVTHAFHMPRALHQFEATGLNVLAAPTGFMSNDEEWDVFSFIPSAFALQKSFLITHEWLGYYWYKIRYS